MIDPGRGCEAFMQAALWQIKDRKFLRARAAKCARFAACFGSGSGASRYDRCWPRLRGLHASGLMANTAPFWQIFSLGSILAAAARPSCKRPYGK